jgi:hypothetical protein
MYKQFIHGDVTVELTWVNEEPHMLIYRSNPGPKEGAYMIELIDAHKYVDSKTGGPSSSLRMDCIEATRAIGFNVHDKYALFKVMTCILDHITDLLAMPPEPKASEIANRPSTGNDELTIKVNGEVVAEVVV